MTAPVRLLSYFNTGSSPEPLKLYPVPDEIRAATPPGLRTALVDLLVAAEKALRAPLSTELPALLVPAAHEAPAQG
jgi:hypothetical protein